MKEIKKKNLSDEKARSGRKREYHILWPFALSSYAYSTGQFNSALSSHRYDLMVATKLHTSPPLLNISHFGWIRSQSNWWPCSALCQFQQIIKPVEKWTDNFQLICLFFVSVLFIFPFVFFHGWKVFLSLFCLPHFNGYGLHTSISVFRRMINKQCTDLPLKHWAIGNNTTISYALAKLTIFRFYQIHP